MEKIIRARKKSRKSTGLRELENWNGELVYAFKWVCVDCDLDPDLFSEDDEKKISDALKVLTREIWIDKTYVEFKGTKFEKTFIYEEGWNSLRELVFDTKFGKKFTEYQRELMCLAYREIITGYIYMALKELGWNPDGMRISVSEDIPFVVEYYPDIAEEWKRYPGKWQTWPENN